MAKSDDAALRAQVFQAALDAELRRQWWCSSAEPVFGQKAIGEVPEPADNDADDEPAAPAFRGLFGEIPGSDSAPLPLTRRSGAA